MLIFTEEKISIFILWGNESSKKDLTIKILGKDLPGSDQNKPNSQETQCFETYENDVYEVTCVYDNDEAYEKTKIQVQDRQPDICLLVLEDGDSTDKVWQKIKDLQEKTGILKEKFQLVTFSDKDFSPLKIYTINDVHSKLNRLTEERNLTVPR